MTYERERRYKGAGVHYVGMTHEGFAAIQKFGERSVVTVPCDELKVGQRIAWVNIYWNGSETYSTHHSTQDAAITSARNLPAGHTCIHWSRVLLPD